MTKIDWEVVTNYIESVGTTDTVFPFNKPQDLVKVTNGGGNNLIYTIGSKAGTLTPGQSITVQETISSITLRASVGKQSFQVWATEAGTEKDEESVAPDLSGIQSQVDSLTTSLAQIDQQKADTTYVDNKVAGAVSGAPIPVLLAANMTDHTRNYVYTGTESGYTAGHWYFWNGSAWSDGGIYQAVVEAFPTQKITLTNKITNGDISKAPSGTGWKLNGSVASWNTNGNTFNFTAGANRGSIITNSAITLIKDHKYYLRVDIKSTTSSVFAWILNNLSPYNQIIKFDNLNYDGVNFYKYASVFTSDNDYTNTIFGVYDNRTSGFDVVSFDNVMMVDLTAAFGAGKEPSSTQFEALISDFTSSWFDATTTIDMRTSDVGDVLLATDFKKDTDIDDTNSINLALGQANTMGGATVRLPYKNEKYVISKTLFISSNTTLLCDKGVEIFLANNSNCRMLENTNKTTQSNLTIIDKNIKIIGGIWQGNGDNQAKWIADGGTCSGFLFSGVENLTFKPERIENTQTYAAWFCNWKTVYAENIVIDQGTMPGTLHNQDGLHFQGPGDTAFVKNIKGTTWDDTIAFNTDDVAQGTYSTGGDIKNVFIEDIFLNGSLNGIRLLSANYLLDKVSIKTLKGTIKDNVIALSSYKLGTGNFGDISIDDICVGTIQPVNIDGNYGGYILINNKVNGKITIKNVRRLLNYDGRPTVRLQTDADVNALELNGLYLTNPVGTATYGDIYVEPTAKCNLLKINGQTIQGADTAKANTGIAVYGYVQKLLINDLFYEKINNVFDLAGNIDYLNAENIKSVDSTSNIKIDGNRVVNTLTITSGATTAGNLTITLQNVATTVAIASTDTTPALVASKIRATSFTSWTVSGTNETVIFTSNQPYITLANQATPLFNGGTTGALGTFASTQGTKNIGKALFKNLDLPKTQAYITTKNITGGDIDAKFDSISHYTQSVDKAIVKSYDVLKFDTKVKDDFSEYVTATGIFTAKHDGYYRLTFGINISSVLANTIKIYLKLNNTTVYSSIQDVIAGDTRYFDINRTFKLKVGDTISMTFANTNDATLLKDSYTFVNRI